MEKSETKVLSIRVGRHLEEEARRFDVDIKGTVEAALKKRIAIEKTKRLAILMKKATTALGTNREDWIKAVREGRDKG